MIYIKTLLSIVICLLTAYHGFAQTESNEDWVNRLWKTSDTVALKREYEQMRTEMYAPKPKVQEPTPFQQQLILQDREFRHEWDMELFRLIWNEGYFYKPLRINVKQNGN